MDTRDVLSGTFDAARLRASADAFAAQNAAALDAAQGGRSDEAAHAFEALLAQLVVKELRRGLPDGVFGAGAGADVFESWFDEHLGRNLAESGALGLAGMVKAGLAKSAEEAAADAIREAAE